MNPAGNGHSVDTPVLGLIRDIKEERLDARSLSLEDRVRCVEVLRGEGYTTAEMAQILQRNERTIRRDLIKIREDHALTPDAAFAQRTIGDLLRQGEQSMAYLRKIARDKSLSGMERLMAECSAWKVYREMFEKLQSVGYLPRVPQGIVADIYQRLEVQPVADYQDLAAEVQRIQQLAIERGGNDAKELGRHEALLDEIELGRLATEVQQLKEQSLTQDRTDHVPSD